MSQSTSLLCATAAAAIAVRYPGETTMQRIVLQLTRSETEQCLDLRSTDKMDAAVVCRTCSSVRSRMQPVNMSVMDCRYRCRLHRNNSGHCVH